ncbi:hypothetical protein SLEP1_g50522 [Rubroshorea leprosula]|uniref:BHLH domain-containing protein n=1 Tax=Rubroshorea leprosula TaxID=152421 RepID=A0AAV5M0J9_9ROSI|nr:hypothetical protein SLEP1_g50522 [Rubroshorea leprosula]
MAEREGFEGERRASSAATASTTPSFSQLLFGDDDDDDVVTGLDYGQSFTYTPVFPVPDNRKPPKMLCFGGPQSDADHEMVLFGGKVITTHTITPQRSGVTCSDSSSASSGNNSIAAASNAIAKSKKKRRGGQESAQCTSNAGVAAAATNQRIASKKSKPENTTSTGTAKRKERLGERITALQQLVSPFGKTDTASVLHEAMGYIRFLQDQVQVLCSPYLHHLRPEGGENGGEELGKDLRSRGLCLVPVACTVHVESSNGADFWSPAMGTHVTQQ